MLPQFFYRLNRKQLFIEGALLDNQIYYKFGWLLFCYPLIKFILPPIWSVLLLDQVSRHVYRDRKDKIIANTMLLYDYLVKLSPVDLDHMSINQLAFTSLATRHLLRILAQKNHPDKWSIISTQMNLFNDVMSQRLAIYSTNLTQLIHSHNKAIYRRYRYIEKDTQCWQIEPKKFYDQSYFNDFLMTEIAQYVIGRLEQLLDLNQKTTIYLMCSGGIDSMTLLRIFNGLRLTNRFINFSYKVLHINWRYRTESDLEASALETLFEKWSVDYQIITSTVDPADPEWNLKSSIFRFNLLNSLATQADHNIYFCLGHIVNDLIENLICNTCLEGSAMGRHTYLNLFGMQELGNGQSLKSDHNFYLLRPLLLHKKPVVEDTPFLKDNATNIDIKRRVVRRLLNEFNFDVSRIRSVYQEALAIRARYQITSNQFKYDKSWSLSEWREVFNNFGGLKKGLIKQLISMLANKDSFSLKSGTKKITIDKEVCRIESL